MRQSITTKYAGPTNANGARIIATTSGGHRLTVPYDHALNEGPNHIAAARALNDKMAWGGEWVGAGSKDGYVFVDISGAIQVWPCGSAVGAHYGVVKGEGFGSNEQYDE